ncbi:hypothetical protein F3Y22_tig00116968pilonHSYRG00037 [Hibiscus syriacus]|uniref:Uncharacterized protein n=1 Tax=Hibiscus syriacus TaxID=106335 RepID=A0A6A2XK33_HIBSY|nr:hypothetical protein F3Y22_tig00116968pilonHSYRG00037 [Hibiscus syriacus]
MLLYSYNHVIHGFSARLTSSQALEIKNSPAHIAVHEEKPGRMIDSGVWPESKIFNEKGMPPIPTRWKGKCHNSTINPFRCNRKLIGAHVLIKGSQAAGESGLPDNTPRDFLGHGTHTSSTAAGNHVPGASQFGYVNGVARGIAPVHMLPCTKYHPENLLWKVMFLLLWIKQLQMESTSSSGNDGEPNTTHNSAPWITTVDAGTLDRSFTATVTLGNNQTFEGKSEFPNRVLVLDASLYYGKSDFDKAICRTGALNESEVFGQVVLCDYDNTISVPEQAEELAINGAAAGILISNEIPYDTGELSIPSLILPFSSGALIKKYATESADARVKIMRFVLTSFGTKPAPQVADFSSRGPDPVNPNILKPNIIAPRVHVLAAFPPTIPIQQFDNYFWLQITHYYQAHQYYGAGHINPNKAMDPGLIYDIDWQGYVDFLCGLGYNDTEMKDILRQCQWNCSQEGSDVNYPSFVAMFSTGSSNVKNFDRVVTNVGDEQSVYHAVVETSYGMTFRVEPTTLTFTSKYQKQSFVASVQTYGKSPPVAYGYLKWVDQNGHIVASPVVVQNS